MAKKAKKRKSKPRRVSGTMALNPTSPIVKWGSVLLGFFMPKPVNNLIDKAAGTLDQKLVAAGQIGLGGAYLLTKGKKNLLLTIASGYTAGAGVKRGLTAFGIGRLGGYGQVPALGGYGQIPALGGYAPQGTLGQYSPQGTLQGANVMGGVGNGAGSGSDLIRDGGGSLMG